MARTAVELHGRIFRDSYLDGLSDRLLRWSEMRDVKCRIFSQLFPYTLIPVTEKAFQPSRSQIPGTVGVTIEAGEIPHRDFLLRLGSRAVGPELLVLVAGEAVALFHGEFVRSVAVALGAFDFFVEDVFRVIP